MDRRIKKSQDAIIKALISLMAEKDFEKITINEIAERANVNRGTIYSHYLDKYDLLDKCIKIHIEQLIESCFPVGDMDKYPLKASLLSTFELMEENAIFFTTILTNKGVPSYRKHLQEIMISGIQEQIVENNIDDMHNDISVQFISAAIVGVIEWWFTHSMPYSAKEVTEQLWTLLERNQIIPRSHS